MTGTEKKRTIQVTGTGGVDVVPDVASAKIGVSIVGRSVRLIVDQLEQRMNDVIGVLRGQGIGDQNIKTEEFNVRAEYHNLERGRELIGYRASHAVRIKVTPPERIGDVIAAAADVGANEVERIYFSSSNPDGAWQEARNLAMADAFARAEQYATLSGLKLGLPLKIVEQGGSGNIVRTYHLAEMSAAPKMMVEPGELRFETEISVKYEALDGSS